jgi:2-octaprenylphenol hydroxylase
MNRKHEIVIVGAGMVGLAAANLLAANRQLRVTVIDAGSRPVFDPAQDYALRVSAVAPGSVDILTRAGAWQEIAVTRISPYRDMKVWDASGNVEGPETLTFDAAEFAAAQLGFIVENVLIRHALLNRLEQSGTGVSFDTPVAAIARNGHRFAIELESGERLEPELLIGADGARSLVRGSAGIAVKSWPHAQKAFVTSLSPELDHRHTAWQRFLEDGPIGLLPLADGRISIVWSTTPDKAEEALQMSDTELSELLTRITDGVLGRLTPAGPKGAFPLQSQHAAEYVQEGLALVGDAAHTVHPLAGQGVNLGFADAYELANVIEAALAADENPGDLPALRKYERARKGANRTMLRFVDGLNRLFSNGSAPLARLRGVGMYLFNHSGPIRSRAVQTALGIR